MKMQYDGQEYDVKLKRPTRKVINAIAGMNDEDADDTDMLDLLVISIDGKPVDEADDELQWAATFAAMQVFQRMTEKKSAANGAGRR